MPYSSLIGIISEAREVLESAFRDLPGGLDHYCGSTSPPNYRAGDYGTELGIPSFSLQAPYMALRYLMRLKTSVLDGRSS